MVRDERRRRPQRRRPKVNRAERSKCEPRACAVHILGWQIGGRVEGAPSPPATPRGIGITAELPLAHPEPDQPYERENHFRSALGFSQPFDSRTFKTSWSVFQDGTSKESLCEHPPRGAHGTGLSGVRLRLHLHGEREDDSPVTGTLLTLFHRP